MSDAYAPDDSGTLLAYRPDGTGPPLYCVPAVSGSPYAYSGLARALDTDQSVYGFEAPGFDDDRAPLTSVPDLAAEYCRTLRAVPTDPPVPVYLLGWSMGGTVAVEMARRLSAAGVPVPLVVLVDTAAPAPAAPPGEAELARGFLYDLVASAGMPWAGFEEALGPVSSGGSAHPKDAFAAVGAAGLLPPEFDATFLLQRYVVYRAHALASYAYPGPAGFKAQRVVCVRADRSPASASGWEPFAASVVEHVVEGDHHTIWTGSSLTEIARLVAGHLAQAQENGRTG